MDTSTLDTPCRIVVLKAEPAMGDLIRDYALELWPHATVELFQVGIDALTAIGQSAPNLFVTGVKIEDMDGLEHLEPFKKRNLPVLIATSRLDPGVFRMLRELRCDGIYDFSTDRLENLTVAMKSAVDRRAYYSPGIAEFLKPRRSITLDELTVRQEEVLALIAIGLSDKEVAARLHVSLETVRTHHKKIIEKLGIHTKGGLSIYAMGQGYIWVKGQKVYFPGFQRRLFGTL